MSESRYGQNKPVRINRVRRLMKDEWFAVWKNCQYATFFHSPQWAELWHSYQAGNISIVPETIEFSDGIVAVLPLLRKKAYKGLLTTTLSSASGTYGGWISADKLRPIHLELLADHMISKGSLRWRISPFDAGTCSLLKIDKYHNNACFKTPSISRKPYYFKADYTHAINTTKNLDSIMSGWTKNNLRALRRTQRLGLEVRNAANRADWRAYFDIYRDALKRWGKNATSHYGWELFSLLSEIKSPYVQLRLAFYKNKPVAGMLCLKSMRHISVWHAVTLTDYLSLRPFNRLAYSAVKDAINNKFEWLDFNPSGGHAGVVLNKERLGAVRMPCPEVLVKSRRTRFVEVYPEILRAVKKKRFGGISDAAA